MNSLLSVYASWADELRSRYERISTLFKHGPSIGRSREVYLADILQRCLPAFLKVTHGAFYSPERGCSREQDVLVVDTREYAAIEELGSFGVYYESAVRACIEVKSVLDKKALADGIKALTAASKLCGGRHSFYGLFAYRSKLKAQEVLDALPETVDFIDYRCTSIIVLGQFVVGLNYVQPAAPRPWIEYAAFQRRRSELDLTLLELLDGVMDFEGNSPLRGLYGFMRRQFRKTGTRCLTLPVDRPGRGMATNR